MILQVWLGKAQIYHRLKELIYLLAESHYRETIHREPDKRNCHPRLRTGMA